jgi:hypothetical protein
MKFLVIALVTAQLLVCFPLRARAQSFDKGRDVVMLSVGVINISLLALIIWQATHRDQASKPDASEKEAKPETNETLNLLPAEPVDTGAPLSIPSTQ